jgi:hypothetical protein
MQAPASTRNCLLVTNSSWPPFPDSDLQDQFIVYGYTLAQPTVQAFKQCGDDRTHEKIMKQAANMYIARPIMLPGIKVKTSPTDYFPVQVIRLQRFNGEVWEWFGEMIGEEGTAGPPPPETAAAWRLL